MLTTAIGSLITALLKNLPEDIIRDGLDRLMDFIEEKVEKTDNKWDDLILPLIQVIRTQIGITEGEGSKYEDTNG